VVGDQLERHNDDPGVLSHQVGDSRLAGGSPRSARGVVECWSARARAQGLLFVRCCW
jgi:hypothetical protein